MYDNFIPLDLKDKIKEEYLDNIFFTNLTEEKVIFISDTHIGSRNENIDYLNQVNQFIKENDVSYLFHGGDLGDGMVNYHKKYGTYSMQIDHLVDVYYDLFDLKQYILGGNHDYRYKRKGIDILRLLAGNSLIESVGYYGAYFKVFDKVISFEHNSRKRNNLISSDFRILGHAHICNFKDRSMTLPASCDEFTNNSLNFNPGFITLESNKIDDEVELKFLEYVYTYNGPKSFKVKKYMLK